MMGYFKSLIGNEMLNRMHVDVRIITIGLMVQKNEALDLCKEIVDEKIKMALWFIRNNKAPDIDEHNS